MHSNAVVWTARALLLSSLEIWTFRGLGATRRPRQFVDDGQVVELQLCELPARIGRKRQQDLLSDRKLEGVDQSFGALGSGSPRRVGCERIC